MKRIAPALVALLLSNCYAAEIANLLARYQKQENEIEQLRSEVADGLTLALCSSELRQLLENVQKECTVADPSATPMCTTKQIKPSVVSADPERKDRFLKLMSHLPHEVVYIGQGATDVVPQRIERLDKLARRALLRNTVFLVVSSPETNQEEAERRAAFVENLLLQQKIPPAKIRRWLYAFPTNRADIDRKLDLPGLVEPRELSRGVWVFRADC